MSNETRFYFGAYIEIKAGLKNHLDLEKAA